VLSWSLLEAMSAGCAIVASDTQPLHEAIKHNETGKLVNFFDHAQLAKEVCDLLDKPEERQRLGANARSFAQQNYDLQTVCLPKQLAWVQGLEHGSKHINISSKELDATCLTGPLATWLTLFTPTATTPN
jgi:hypothetical protein